MKRPKLLHAPDGVTSATSAEAALENTFGPLSSIRPDLAAAEAEELETKKESTSRNAELRLGRPVLDREQTPSPAEEAKDEADKPKKKEASEAALDEPPAGDETESGSDQESPDEDQAALDALLAKYQGKPRSMAQALREMRSLQTKTAEEKKEIEQRLEAAASVLDADYDWVDGKPVLKTDVAARHLRARRDPSSNPLRMPTEEQVRAQVEAQFREKAQRMVDDENIPTFMAEMKSVMDQTVNERMAVIKTQIDTQRMAMQVAVGDIVGRHVSAHPEHKDLLPEIDKFYAGIPEEARTIAFLEDWVPFQRIAELLHTERSVKKIAADAYQLGKKARGQAAVVTESGSPGRSRPAPTNGRGNSSDAVKAFKDGVVRGSGLPSLDNLFA